MRALVDGFGWQRSDDITSGYSNFGDIFGDVPAMHAQLQAQADQWWPDGEATPPEAPDVPDLPPPEAAGRLVVVQATVNKAWIYLEWRPVPGEVSYTHFVVLDPGDDSVGAYAFRQSAGKATRSGNRFAYFRVSELCARAATAGLPGGTYRAWAQVWPGEDDRRAENGPVAEPVSCP